MIVERKVSESDKIELERKKQVLLLRNLYRSFVDSTFELFFRSSAEGQILFCNKLFVTTFSFPTYQKAKGYPVEQLFEDPEDCQRIFEKLRSGRRVQQQAVNFKKANGKKVVAIVNAQSQQNELGELVFNWTALDISERLEFEQNLEFKNAQLAKINHQMEKFLYSTSHDLRAPLTSILGLVNLVRMDTTDQKVVDLVGKIETSAMKLDKIIRDIISFSKTTYKNIHSERIDFGRLLWKVINFHRGEENFDKIKVEVTIHGNAPFYNDTDRLEIILDNLIRNGIQFMDPKKLRPFLHILVHLAPESVTVEIHDNGVGIARQYFEQIFNMFFKASVQSKGAGLGLYIAKEGAEQLGGLISLESEVGFGSVFRVVIPNSPKGRLINRKNQLLKGE